MRSLAGGAGRRGGGRGGRRARAPVVRAGQTHAGQGAATGLTAAREDPSGRRRAGAADHVAHGLAHGLDRRLLGDLLERGRQRLLHHLLDRLDDLPDGLIRLRKRFGTRQLGQLGERGWAGQTEHREHAGGPREHARTPTRLRTAAQH